jgi:hypothetical protein
MNFLMKASSKFNQELMLFFGRLLSHPRRALQHERRLVHRQSPITAGDANGDDIVRQLVLWLGAAIVLGLGVPRGRVNFSENGSS